MHKRYRDEDGMAMIVSLLVSFVVLILTTVVIAQSIHDVEGSGYDRRRLQSVNAAEAGGNYFYAYLQSTPVVSVTETPVTQTIGSGPATATFTATPVFYDAAGAVIHPPFTAITYPSSVLVESTGTVSGQTPRKWQTYIRLTPVYGAGHGAAVLVNSSANFQNSFDIFGNVSYDGDIYVLNGDFSLANSAHVRGNVFVPNGQASMINSGLIEGDVWSSGNIGMANSATINGNAISSTGNISMVNNSLIARNATAAGTITVTNPATISGTRYPNTPSPPPPSQTFPQITYVQQDWIDAGYTNFQTFTGGAACTQARNYITGAWSGNTVVRITGANPCNLSFQNQTNVTVNGNLAIITDWGVTMQNQSNWDAATTTKDVFFISTWPANGCPADQNSNKNITTSNNTSMNTFVRAYFYTPCTATMSNLSNWYGQVIANTANITNNFNMTFRPMVVPGITEIEYFDEDIAYVREVTA